MSYTTIVGFHKETGEVFLEDDINNSHRGSIIIWRTLEERYLPPYFPDCFNTKNITTREEFFKKYGFVPSRISSMSNVEEIWNLANDKNNVSIDEKIVLCTTFDKCLVKREDMLRVVEAFRNFDAGEYNENCSLKEQADIIEEFYKNEDCIAIGWNQTSVCQNRWTCIDYDEENDEVIPYNIHTMTDHFFLPVSMKEEDGL